MTYFGSKTPWEFDVTRSSHKPLWSVSVMQLGLLINGAFSQDRQSPGDTRSVCLIGRHAKAGHGWLAGEGGRCTGGL